MADIKLLGATFYGVPAVELPTDGGGTSTFYEVSGSQTITSNGTYDVTNKASVVVNVSGGGVVVTQETATGGGIIKHITAGSVDTLQAKTVTPTSSTQVVTPDTGYDGLSSVTVGPASTNLITGTFTGTTAGSVLTITLPYTGNGYPIGVLIYPKDGPYKSGTEIYTLIQRYAIVSYMMTKSEIDTAPTYSTSGTANYGTVRSMYKSSTSSSTSYSTGSGQTANNFSSSSANASSTTCVRFRNNTTMTVYIASTSFGFASGMPYTYQVIYSE